eukprot:11419074-Heterocapsa_arctica.AAC.1
MVGRHHQLRAAGTGEHGHTRDRPIRGPRTEAAESGSEGEVDHLPGRHAEQGVQCPGGPSPTREGGGREPRLRPLL